MNWLDEQTYIGKRVNSFPKGSKETLRSSVTENAPRHEERSSRKYPLKPTNSQHIMKNETSRLLVQADFQGTTLELNAVQTRDGLLGILSFTETNCAKTS
jgi:hypothetical protein